MGYELSRWAQTVEHPCLTARTRQVFSEICMVAHDEHGEFWMRGQKFVSEHIPGMSYSAYRNHLNALVKNNLLIKVAQGGGRVAYGGSTTRYRVNSPVVKNPHPPQGVLPDIPKSPEAQPPTPEVSVEPATRPAIEVHQRLDELLSAGFTTEQMIAAIESVQDSPTDSINLSEKRTGSDEEPDLTQITLSDSQVNLSEFGVNLSENRTGFPYIEDKRRRKEDLAAAATGNLSDLPEESFSRFFELLAKSLAEAGHPGIRAAQFSDLKDFLADYANITGSPPDQRTADYIVRRVIETAGIRNVPAFVRRIARDVLTTGEGYVALETAPAPSLPSEHPAEPSPPPDWSVLHLAHGEQVSSAKEIWDAVLELLRSQVSKIVFDTWLSEANGAAYAEGRFVVGSANSFSSEMVKNRMDPQIERAVRDVTGTDVTIEYAVVASDDRMECPLCRAEDVSLKQPRRFMELSS